MDPSLHTARQGDTLHNLGPMLDDLVLSRRPIQPNQHRFHQETPDYEEQDDVDLDMLLGCGLFGSQQPLLLDNITSLPPTNNSTDNDQMQCLESPKQEHHTRRSTPDRNSPTYMDPIFDNSFVYRSNRAQAIDIGNAPYGDEEDSIHKSLSLPLRQVTPDPFPELSNSPLSPTSSQMQLSSSKSSPSSPLARRVLTACTTSRYMRLSNESLESTGSADMNWKPTGYVKTMVNFYTDERSCKPLSLDENMNASDVAHMLVLKNHAKEDKNWVIVERIETSKFVIERSLEDHESVYNVHRHWGSVEDNRFYFRKDFRKYELFQNPTQFFPAHMIDTKGLSTGCLSEGVERHKNILLQNLFSCNQLPDIQGHLYVKEGKKSWKKRFFILRNSGVYFSNKGTSKEPRHLVFCCQLNDLSIYAVLNAKKTLAAPNNFCFCLKPQHHVSDPKDLRLFCAEDEQSRLCWTASLRLVTYGTVLKDNYTAAISYESKLQSIENKDSSSKTQEVPSIKSRVAMDFTGRGGRVVEDPNEALGVAIEEARHWRRKVARPGNYALAHSPPLATSFLSDNPARAGSFGITAGVHMSQSWFHSGISRVEAVNLISQHGMVDGVFLIRESNSVSGAFVLSLAHKQKVKHCQILKMECSGDLFYSLDKGRTKFSDLIQLVEFYQLNAGGLPTRLTHYVTKLA